MNEVLTYSDGGSRGNPGPSAYGVVVYEVGNGSSRPILAKLNGYLGEHTNNYAEYMGLLKALEWATLHNVQVVHAFLDSELVVRQVQGKYTVRVPALIQLYDEVCRQLALLKRFNINHVPREQNALADALVNEALDAEISKKLQ